MPHPERWRDTCDPFALPYRTFQPMEILGYPHAGNDVFHAHGLLPGRAGDRVHQGGAVAKR